MAARFNPPPGWPVPPPGWTPPDGWQPDPTWPPAPPGWQFWVEDAYVQPSAASGAAGWARRPWLIGGAAVAILLVGIAIGSGGRSGGGDVDEPPTAFAATETTAQETAEPDATTTPAADPDDPDDEPTEDEPDTFEMPDLVGLNLQYAQDTLQALGSYSLDQEDASGLDRFQVNDSNWKVCRQDPEAGTEIPTDTLVTLWSVKLDETCP